MRLTAAPRAAIFGEAIDFRAPIDAGKMERTVAARDAERRAVAAAAAATPTAPAAPAATVAPPAATTAAPAAATAATVDEPSEETGFSQHEWDSFAAQIGALETKAKAQSVFDADIDAETATKRARPAGGPEHRAPPVEHRGEQGGASQAVSSTHERAPLNTLAPRIKLTELSTTAMLNIAGFCCGQDMYRLSLSARRPFFVGYEQGKRVLATDLLHVAMRSWLQYVLDGTCTNVAYL